MADDLPVLSFPSAHAWETWLEAHHEQSAGVWLAIAKKGAAIASVSYAEAVDAALAFGWIDGQKRAADDTVFHQRFTPRRPRSRWSKINRQKAEALTATGRMRPAGKREVEAAKADGRWDAAYDGARSAQVPADLQDALNADPAAAKAFAALDGTNRYSILYRVQDAKKPETRQRRIEQFVAMLAAGDKPHP